LAKITNSAKRKEFYNCMDLIKFASLKGRVAQLDRAPDYGSGGWGFDSSLVHAECEAVTQNGRVAASFVCQRFAQHLIFFAGWYPITQVEIGRKWDCMMIVIA
jgi:hypothetical protein